MTMIIDYTCSSIRRKGLRSGENSAHKASPIEKEISNNRGTSRTPPLQIPTGFSSGMYKTCVYWLRKFSVIGEF